MTRREDESHGLPSLREQVEHFFGEVLGAGAARRASLEVWNPTLDLLEEEDRFVLLLDVPGVREEDLRVEIEGSRLTVSGSREFVRRYPVATKRAVRAILRTSDLCAADPERASTFVMSPALFSLIQISVWRSPPDSTTTGLA